MVSASPKPTSSNGGSTDTEPGGDERRARVIGNRVLVYSDIGITQGSVSVFARVRLADQVNQHQVILSAARNNIDATIEECCRHRLGVYNHLLLVFDKFRALPLP